MSAKSGGKSKAVYALSFVYNKILWEEKLILVRFLIWIFISLLSASPAARHTVHIYVEQADVLILLFNNYRSAQESAFIEAFLQRF